MTLQPQVHRVKRESRWALMTLAVTAALIGGRVTALGQSPTFSLDHHSGERGDTVYWQASGFEPQAAIHLTEDGNTIGTQAGPVFFVTDLNGGASGSLIITTDDTFGDHNLCAVEDQNPSLSACDTFTVNNPATGPWVFVFVILGIAILGGGALAVILLSRRRQPALAPAAPSSAGTTQVAGAPVRVKKVPYVFINYRREDAAGHAGRLCDQLSATFGGDHVFRDLGSIWPGVDYHQAIAHAVKQTDLMLVLIGSTWLSVTDSSGARRLDDPNDVLVAEIGAALEARRWVMPILVQGAPMPSVSQLPLRLRAMASLNAFTLTEEHWDSNVSELVRMIEWSLRAA